MQNYFDMLDIYILYYIHYIANTEALGKDDV